MTIISKCPLLSALFGTGNQSQKEYPQHALDSISTQFLEYDMQTIPLNPPSRRLQTRYVEYYIPTLEIIRTAREFPSEYFF